MNRSASDVQQVVAAVIINPAGQVLLARRPLDRHQGGLWEFPGGKLERGEEPRAALVRELHEELGIVARAVRPLIKVAHAYPEKSVLLDVWRVNAFNGEPHGREGQPIEWVFQRDLPYRDFPAANRPIVTAARLPSVYLITPEPDDTARFFARLEALLAAGIDLVQLRAKTFDEAAYIRLARQAVSLCAGTGVRLLLNAPPALAEELGAAGVHLPSAALMALNERPLSPEQWVAASCHSRAELEHARRIGVDFVVVAPVAATGSHPEARPLGWHNLRRLAEPATLPVYALGGVALQDIPVAWEHGCQGIASISGLWAAQRLSQLLPR
jgi:8-oxo-dGTP diphosphatase